MKLVSGTGMFEAASFSTGLLTTASLLGAYVSFPALRFLYNSFVCSEGSIPNSFSDLTQRSYVAATYDMSPFAA